jgi:hypothetical protein
MLSVKIEIPLCKKIASPLSLKIEKTSIALLVKPVFFEGVSLILFKHLAEAEHDLSSH